VYVKSTLKIQNRSVEVAGDDEDDVDNVPLYGRTYEGNGSGMDSRNPRVLAAAVDFYSHKSTGMINVIPGSSDMSLREPPLPNNFVGVKDSQKFSLSPGKIKTSILETHIKGTSLHRLMRTLYDPTNSGDVYRNTTYGSYRVMGYEKVILAEASKLTTSIAYEKNDRIAFKLNTHWNNSTNEYFMQQFL